MPLLNQPASPSKAPADQTSRPRLRALQIGMSWFPQQPGNGLDRMFYGLAQHLPGAGVDARSLVVGSEIVSSDAVRAVAPSDAPLSQRLWRLRQAVAAEPLERYDVVAAHFALYALPALDRLRRRPFVVHFHGPWAAESKAEGEGAVPTFFKTTIERLVYGRADRFVVLSEAFRDVLVRDHGISERRIRIVPGGVDAARFDTGLTRHAARERLDWPTDRPIALSVRRLVRRVGLENLIDAMNAVRQQHPEALLLIAGRGPLADALKAQIVHAGLEHHVRLLGFVPDAELPLAYRAADVSVVPTAALEGFGLIAAESLAAGTPPLVTPVGGLPEVVRALSPRLVLPGAHPAALAEGLAGAFGDALALPSAEACQAYACRRFDWPAVAAQTRTVYEELC